MGIKSTCEVNDYVFELKNIEKIKSYRKHTNELEEFVNSNIQELMAESPEVAGYLLADLYFN